MVLKPFRAALVAALAASAGAGVAAAETGDAPNVTANACEKRTLVLSAFPAEADAVLSHTALDPSPVVVADRRHFYLGTIGGKKVIVAMTGIGLVNATQTAETAFARFTCPSSVSIGAVVFSGVAGGGARVNIADVAVPARWTTDGGATFHPVDPGMLAAAQALSVDLESVVRLIDLKRAPRLVVGGDGFSTDNNNGRAFPCIPNGGDVFGCQPCSAPDRSLFYTGNFFQAAGPWLKNALISNLGIASTANPAFDATDNETAAVQAVADAHGTPFLGIRGISDGPGDPLRLPGFPFEFFFYKQIAADNAARVTAAFLRSWARV
ncbi:5'-methylthioadenosine/S-adenosylhomocysteine nucleosidase [Mycobacterium alsense]|uniref:5'-methylthioadenosine/S-adenosylhomocysteine nucleosidase family protein n=1 Tax=Mycobacterium alsense TaxID=324058 RepID=UPI0009F49CA8|nr:5'-methylthioadenosine/S-adenosylhomocysteine nucleosidase [Mycobacterium alsense]